MFSIVTLIGGISTIALQYVLKGSMEMGSASVIGLGHLVGFAVLVHIFHNNHIIKVCATFECVETLL